MLTALTLLLAVGCAGPAPVAQSTEPATHATPTPADDMTAPDAAAVSGVLVDAPLPLREPHPTPEPDPAPDAAAQPTGREDPAPPAPGTEPAEPIDPLPPVEEHEPAQPVEAPAPGDAARPEMPEHPADVEQQVAGAPIPPGQLLPADASIDQVLHVLQRVGQDLRNFAADVTQLEIDNMTGDTTTYRGQIFYQRVGEGDSRIRVVFTARQAGRRPDPNFRREYLLRDRWFIEVDHGQRLQTEREVLRPGQTADMLRLGEGRFPIPIGQDPVEVHRHFEVTQPDRPADGPENTVLLRLTPRQGTQFSRQFASMEVWVDRQSHFPVRIDTDQRSHTTLQTTLANLQLNADLPADAFELPHTEGFRRIVDQMD